MAGSALAEGRHSCNDPSKFFDAISERNGYTVGDYTALPLCSVMIITPPYVLSSHDAHKLSGES